MEIVSLDDSRIERVHDRLASLCLLTVRVVALEYSQLHKKYYNLVVCEFGGFENVYCVMRASVYRRYDYAHELLSVKLSTEKSISTIIISQEMRRCSSMTAFGRS